MTPEEYRFYIQNWQNPRAVPMPGAPALPNVGIPSGSMMPNQPPRSALQRIPLRNPLAFDVPNVGIPDVEIPTKANEMLRAAGNQPRGLNYTGADLRGLAEPRTTSAPPRPISGMPPAVPRAGTMGVPARPYVPANASALVPRVEGGLRPPFMGLQPPFIEGEFARVDTRPVPVRGTPKGASSQTASRSPKGDRPRPTTGGARRGGPPLYVNPDGTASSSLPKPRPSATSRVVGGLASAAVPAVAASIASQIQEMHDQQDPLYGKSPEDLAFLAESDPAFYARHKKEIDAAIQNLTTPFYQGYDRRTGKPLPPMVGDPLGQSHKGWKDVGEWVFGRPSPEELQRRQAVTRAAMRAASGLPPASISSAQVDEPASSISSAPASAPAPVPAIGVGMDMPERIARSQPGWAKQQAMAGTLRDLREEGFAPVSGLPGGIDPRSGNPWLGPNQIMVREGSVGPEAYQAAMDARGDAVQRGQDAGFERSQGYGGYLPNLPTRQALQEGGPITEYAVPGKGTATFLGERQGGGTLSVVGGRTPEEQAIIDQRVAGIDSQTAAMRDLRNAQRLAQGLPTVEQAEQMAAMQRMMPAPPSTRDLDLQEAELMRQLQGVGDIRGFGSRRRRADAIQAAQTGLAAIANQRQALNQGYQAQLAQTQGLMGLQASERQKAIEAQLRQRAAEQAQRAAEQDQQRWETEFNFNRTKAQVEAMEKDRQYLMDVLKETPELDDKAMLDIRERFMREMPPTRENPTGGKVFDEQEFRGALGVEPFTSNTQPRAGKVYYKEDENSYMLATPEGLVEIGGPDEFLRYRHRQIQQQQRSALLGR